VCGDRLRLWVRTPARKEAGMQLRIAALLAILVAFVVAPNAAADKPLKVPVVIEPLTLTGVCDFPVLLEAVGPQNQKIITFSDGRQIINGQLTVRATNLDDPSKVWQGTASGPLILDPLPDGSLAVKGTGVNLWYFFPGNLGAGEPGALLLVKGLSTEVLDPAGEVVTGSFVHRGSIENLCVTLA
jgi:hypothetical protein